MTDLGLFLPSIYFSWSAVSLFYRISPLPDRDTITPPFLFFFVKFTYGRVTLYCTNVKSVKRVQFPKNHCIKEML